MRYSQLDTKSTTMESFVLELIQYGAKGLLVAMQFHGHMYYSDKISFDEICINETGMKYSEYVCQAGNKQVSHKIKSNIVDQTKYFSREQENVSLDTESIKKSLLSRGHSILEPAYYNKWDQYVEKYIDIQGFIDVFNYSLEVLEYVNRGELAIAASKFFACPPSFQKNICTVVKSCSTYGKNFEARVSSQQRIQGVPKL